MFCLYARLTLDLKPSVLILGIHGDGAPLSWPYHVPGFLLLQRFQKRTLFLEA